jgi:hypothetical protein
MRQAVRLAQVLTMFGLMADGFGIIITAVMCGLRGIGCFGKGNTIAMAIAAKDMTTGIKSAKINTTTAEVMLMEEDFNGYWLLVIGYLVCNNQQPITNNHQLSSRFSLFLYSS